MHIFLEAYLCLVIFYLSNYFVNINLFFHALFIKIQTLPDVKYYAHDTNFFWYILRSPDQLWALRFAVMFLYISCSLVVCCGSYYFIKAN